MQDIKSDKIKKWEKILQPIVFFALGATVGSIATGLYILNQLNIPIYFR